MGGKGKGDGRSGKEFRQQWERETENPKVMEPNQTTTDLKCKTTQPSSLPLSVYPVLDEMDSI